MDSALRIKRNGMILEKDIATNGTGIPFFVFILNTRSITTASTKIFNHINIAEAHLYGSSILKWSFPFVVLEIIQILFNSMPLSKIVSRETLLTSQCVSRETK